MPLLVGDDSVLILLLIPPPELHLLLGVANKILDCLNVQWGEDKAYIWTETKCIVRKGYRGGCMEGNACKKLLLKAAELEADLPTDLKEFAICLKKFNLVRTACFGTELHPEYKDHIEAFKKSYLSLDIRKGCQMILKQ